MANTRDNFEVRTGAKRLAPSVQQIPAVNSGSELNYFNG